MKKRILAMSLALTLLFALAGGEVYAKCDDASCGCVYEDVTGIPGNETAVTVDGNEIPSQLYLYWAAFNCSAMEYQIRMYHEQYGLYEDLIGGNFEINWDGKFSTGRTLNEYVDAKTDETVRFYATIENLAAKHGVELSAEAQAAIDSERDSMIAQLGGADKYQAYLREIGLSEENFRRINRLSGLLDGLCLLADDEGSKLFLKEEDYDRYIYCADRILLSTVDLATDKPLSEEEAAEKKALAEELLAQLKGAGDKEALFKELADQYSEDEGRGENPDGWLFTPGSVAQSFETAVEALKIGEISGILESDYGYYIVLRKDPRPLLREDSFAKAEMNQAYMAELINELAAKADTDYSKKLKNFDFGKFYNAYLQSVMGQ